ncbi:MAG: nucleotidyltransferase domain-containing protein [Acidobacteriota bacterium]|nr:nucleotidyltransferase domain-containing protein [Acidobacteriota bacterium]
MLTLHPEEQTWLEKYRKALKERHRGAVLRMVIYGSKARGDAHQDSDIDVLIIVKNEANGLKRPLRRIGYDLAATSWAVPSIMAYTQAEWERLATLQSTFREAVERDGVPVL